MRTAEHEERRQRVRIGLTGLACVFLLVLLGTAISRSGSASDPVNETANAMKVKDPEDPLAQIGAAPGSAAANTAADNGDAVPEPVNTPIKP